MVEVFGKLQALEEKGEYKRALAQASKLAERGFTPEEFSVLEEGSLTPEEAEAHEEIRKKRAEGIRGGYEAHFGVRWKLWGDRLARLSGFTGPAANLAREEDEAFLALDRAEATDLIKERVSERTTAARSPFNFFFF